MDTGNSKQCSTNKTKKSDDDNKVSDSMLGSDFEVKNTSSDHFCKNVVNNGGSLAQEDNSTSISAMHIPIDEAPAISHIGNLSKPFGQPDTENLRGEDNLGIHNQSHKVLKPVGTSDVKILSDQPDYINLDFDLLEHIPFLLPQICKDFSYDTQKHIEREFEGVANDASNSKEHVQRDLKVVTNDSSNSQVHVEGELKGVTNDASNSQEHAEGEFKRVSNDANNSQEDIEGELKVVANNANNSQEHIEGELKVVTNDANNSQEHVEGELKVVANDANNSQEHPEGELKGVPNDAGNSQEHIEGELKVDTNDANNRQEQVEGEFKGVTNDASNSQEHIEGELKGVTNDANNRQEHVEWELKGVTNDASNSQFVITNTKNSLKGNKNHPSKKMKTEVIYMRLQQPATCLRFKSNKIIRSVMKEYFSNGSHIIESCSYEEFEFEFEFSTNVEYYIDLKSKVKAFLSNIGWHADFLTEDLKTMVSEFFKEHNQYLNKENFYHVKKFYLNHKVLHWHTIITNAVVRAEPDYLNPGQVNGFNSLGLVTSYNDFDQEDNALMTSNQGDSVQNAEGNSITQPTAEQNTLGNNIIQLTAEQNTLGNNIIQLTAEQNTVGNNIIQPTAEQNTVGNNIIQPTAEQNTPSRNTRTIYSITATTSITGTTREEQCTESAWNINAEASQRTQESWTMTSRAVQCTEGARNITAGAIQSTHESCSMTSWAVQCSEGAGNQIAGIIQSTQESCSVTSWVVQCTEGAMGSTAATSPSTGAFGTHMTAEMIQSSRGAGQLTDQRIEVALDIRSGTVQNAVGNSTINRVEESINVSSTVHISHRAPPSRNLSALVMDRINTTSVDNRSTVMTVPVAPCVIVSDPVRMNGQQMGANYLANRIQYYRQGLGLTLPETPKAGPQRPDTCSPDTVMTIVALAVIFVPAYHDYLTRDPTGVQVLDSVQNFLEQNFADILMGIKHKIREINREEGDIQREAHVASAMIGDTKIKESTTCTHKECKVINSRMTTSPLTMFNQGNMNSTILESYLNQHEIGREKPCRQCTSDPVGISQIRRNIDSSLIYVNAYQAQILKVHVKDMLRKFRVGNSVYQVHAVSFWHDHHFTARINIQDQWWTYDNKMGLYNQGIEVDDGNSGLLSGIYIKKIQ